MVPQKGLNTNPPQYYRSTLKKGQRMHPGLLKSWGSNKTKSTWEPKGMEKSPRTNWNPPLPQKRTKGPKCPPRGGRPNSRKLAPAVSPKHPPNPEVNPKPHQAQLRQLKTALKPSRKNFPWPLNPVTKLMGPIPRNPSGRTNPWPKWRCLNARSQ